MIYEYSYSTREEGSAVLGAALTALESAGYTVTEAPTDDAILARRGAKSLRRAKALHQTPISVCVHDRHGLVSVGIDIECKGRKPDKALVDYAAQLCDALRTMHGTDDPAMARIDLNVPWLQVMERSKKLRRRDLIILCVALAMPVLLVVLVIAFG